MTKYILNSGGVSKRPAKAVLFFNEIIKDLGKNPKILNCLFALPREDWELRFRNFSDLFNQSIDNEIKPIFDLAFPDKFVEQVKNSDAVILSGGDDHLLSYWLRQYNLPEIWSDKIIATNSASSDVLSGYFWTCDWRQCLDGLGILPIKFLPHYKSEYGVNDPRGPIDWDKAHRELAEYGDKKLPIHALEDGDFIVIEK